MLYRLVFVYIQPYVVQYAKYTREEGYDGDKKALIGLCFVLFSSKSFCPSLSAL